MSLRVGILGTGPHAINLQDGRALEDAGRLRAGRNETRPGVMLATTHRSLPLSGRVAFTSTHPSGYLVTGLPPLVAQGQGDFGNLIMTRTFQHQQDHGRFLCRLSQTDLAASAPIRNR